MIGLNPVVASKIEYLMQQRSKHYERVRLIREYVAGDTPDLLTDDQKILLVGDDGAGNPASDPEFNLNVCELPVSVEVDRLNVRDIEVVAQDDPELSQQLSKLAWGWWKRSRMDEGQQHAHYSACRDSDSFGVTWWDEDGKYPRVTIHQLYDGETAGADVFYINGDPMQPMSAIKIWTHSETEQRKIRRKNVYYADRVEKWISDGGMIGEYNDADWRHLVFTDDDYDPSLAEVPSLSQPGKTATVTWWTETGTERAAGMGLPVKHFRHDARGTEYGTSTVETLVPGVQDATNRAALSVQTASMLSGFKVTWMTGLDSNATTVTVHPGALLTNVSSDGSVGQLTESDLRQLVEVKDSWVKDAATLTKTPLTYFNLSGVIPAEGTQQSLEQALQAKVKQDQVSFGNTWEDVFRMMFKMEKTWGSALVNVPVETLETIEINCVWDSAKVEDEREQAEIAQIHKALGVTDRKVFKKLGYSEDQIDAMLIEKQTKQNAIIGTLAQRVQQMEAGDDATDDTADTTDTDDGANIGT